MDGLNPYSPPRSELRTQGRTRALPWRWPLAMTFMVMFAMGGVALLPFLQWPEPDRKL